MHAFLICGQDQNRVGERIENLLKSRLGKISASNRLNLYPSAKKETKLPTLTIEDVRFISNWLSQQSTKSRAVIVHEAQCMTIPAQQAFLKTLEEPGGSQEYGVGSKEYEVVSKEYGVRSRKQEEMGNGGTNNITIILTADSETSLLPTIRSRCKIIRLPAETSTTYVDSQRYSVGILHDLTEIGNRSPSERLTILYDLLSEFSGKKFSPNQRGSIPRPDAIKFMEHIIDGLHSFLIHKSLFINSPRARLDSAKRVEAGHKSMTSTIQSACLAHRRLKNNLNVQLALQQFILDIPTI